VSTPHYTEENSHPVDARGIMIKPCVGMQEIYKPDFASQILSSEENAENVSSLLKVQEAFQIHDR